MYTVEGVRGGAQQLSGMPSAQHLTAAALLATGALAIDNGVSRTPPMCAPRPPSGPPLTPNAADRGPQATAQAAGLG